MMGDRAPVRQRVTMELPAHPVDQRVAVTTYRSAEGDRVVVNVHDCYGGHPIILPPDAAIILADAIKKQAEATRAGIILAPDAQGNGV